MDVWESIPSGRGGDITVLHEHNGYLFAGTMSGGVYRSSDGGNTWYLSMLSKRMKDTWTIHLVQCFFSYNSILYCGTNAGLEVSTDNGNTWSSLFSGMKVYTISAYEDVILIGGDGIYYLNTRTKETGLLKTSPHFGSVYSLNCNGDTIVAGYCCGYGLYRSVDKGVNWARYEYNIKPGSIMKVERKFGYDFVLNSTELLRCKPSETYWQTCGGKKLSEANIIGFTSHKEKLYVYTTDKGVLCSSDSGITWLPFTFRPARNSITALFFPQKNDSIALVGFNSEIGKTGSETTKSGGVATCNLQSKELKYTLPCISTQRYDNILTFEDNLMAFEALGSSVRVEPQTGKYAVQQTDTLLDIQQVASNTTSYFVYTNSGARGVYAINKKTKKIECITSRMGDFGIINSLTANDAVVAMIVDQEYVRVTTNSGETWINVYTSAVPSESPRSIAVTEKIILIYTFEGILRSTDMGETWQKIPHPTGATVRSLHTLLRYVLLLTDSGLYMSTNGGESWLRQNIGQTKPEYIVPALHSEIAYIACNTGIYQLNTSTMNWILLYEAKSNEYFTALSVNGSEIIAARNSNGLWKMKRSELSGETSVVASAQEKCLPVSVVLFYSGMPIDSVQWSMGSSMSGRLVDRVIDTITITEAGDYTLQLKAFKNGTTFTYTEYLNKYKLLDTTLQVINGNIVSNATGVRYQWLDCSNNYIPITGATSKTFKPFKDGRYAVEISQDDCTDTSAVLDYSTITTVQELDAKDKTLVISPNPPSDKLTISFPIERNQHIVIDVFDINGKRVMTLLDQDMLVGKYQLAVSTSTLSQGYYQILLHNDTNVTSHPFLIYR